MLCCTSSWTRPPWRKKGPERWPAGTRPTATRAGRSRRGRPRLSGRANDLVFVVTALMRLVLSRPDKSVTTNTRQAHSPREAVMHRNRHLMVGLTRTGTDRDLIRYVAMIARLG